jgi:futalosine hydrolase
MRILITSATVFEIRPLLERLTFVLKKNDFVREYKVNEVVIDVMIPGIGIMATAWHMGRQLSKEKYDLAINAGICGSYSPATIQGEVFEIMEECITDLGAEDSQGFLTAFDLGLIKPDSDPFRGGLLINPGLIRSGVLERIPKAKGATVSSIPGKIRKSAGKLPSYIPATESMEGAAFFYACLLEGVPFTEIRSVSNFVEERNKSRWYIEEALMNLNQVLIDLLQEQTKNSLRV